MGVSGRPRVVIYLEHDVDAFRMDEVDIATLAARAPEREFLRVRSEREFFDALADASVAVAWDFRAEWYALAPRLELVATPSAGRERVHADPSGRARVAYGTFHGAIMAESLLAMVLFMHRKLGHAEQARREHAWDRSAYVTTRPLSGQIALILGYGHIGAEVARVLSAVGVRVRGLRRDPTRAPAGAEHVYALSELHAALAEADHAVCILPGGQSTTHLIDAAALARMKPSAYLYNLGRGNAVDEVALRDALTNGCIAGAFLDVFEEEPLPEASPLWDTPNLYITPHASAIRSDYLSSYFVELAALLD
jgi:phosphoglycerate dehydrogenase-like enzyme